MTPYGAINVIHRKTTWKILLNTARLNTARYVELIQADGIDFGQGGLGALALATRGSASKNTVA